MLRLFHAFWIVLLILLSAQTQAQTYSYEGSNPKVVIDVRTPEEFAAGHIEGATNIPYDQIGSRIATLGGLGKDDQILVYCHSGRRSAIAKQELVRLGYRHVQDGGALNTLTSELKVCKSTGC